MVAAAIAGTGIAPHRLNDDRCIDADLFGLTSCKEMEVGARDDNGRREHRIPHAQQRFLIGRSVADQRQELLRQGVARDRPKPRSGTSCQQNWDDK
jgi:hypothetical protein